MNITIKSLADELGVSKPTISKFMDSEFKNKYTTKERNRILISDKGAEIIRQKLSQKSENDTENHFAKNENDDLAFFKKQLEEKDKQIEQLSAQLDTSQRINETLSISVQMEQAKTGQLQLQLEEMNNEKTVEIIGNQTEKTKNENAKKSKRRFFDFFKERG